MSDIIKPTVGRKVWYRPQGASFLKPDGMVVTTPSVYGDQPLDATVIYVWNDLMVNLDVTDHAGNRFIATSAILVQEGDHKPSGAYAEWMPYQQGQSSKAAAAAGNDHATQVLYPAIKAAMDELEKLGEFLNSSTFEALPEEQRKLLIMQRNTMRNYSWILGKLIELFKPRKEMLSLPVIDMSALAETVIESSRFKDGAR